MSTEANKSTKQQIETTICAAGDSLWEMMMDKEQYDQMPEAARPMVEAAMRQLAEAIKIIRE